MPLIHRGKTVKKLLAISSLEEQERFYDQTWNNRRWQGLFRIFFGKFLLGRLGRDRDYFRYVKVKNIAEEILNWTQHGLTEIPIQNNYFIEYILTGRYSNLDLAHPYLQASNFNILKERIGRVQLVCQRLEDYLKILQRRAISKFNLSDIFEYKSVKEVKLVLQKILRVSRPDARLAFWTLFIPRTVPSALIDQITPHSTVSEKLRFAARTFFYGNFCLWKVN
jgi:S-adenosylmethionine-diacylglycerol 3-amino-3-carboxypropyl transferase